MNRTIFQTIIGRVGNFLDYGIYHFEMNCTIFQTIVGGVGDCLDYGIYHFENFWVYYKGTDSACTRGIDSGVRIQTGQWYLVAIIHNGTHVTSYVNGKQNHVKVYLVHSSL